MIKKNVTEKSKKNLKSWKKGTSGNPKGRKRGSKNFATLLKELLDINTLVLDPFTGKKRYMSNREKILLRVFVISQKPTTTNKDLKAAEMLMDREDGKPLQMQQITHAEDQSLLIKEINEKMTNKEAAEIYMREIKDPSISKAFNEKNARKRKPKKTKE